MPPSAVAITTESNIGYLKDFVHSPNSFLEHRGMLKVCSFFRSVVPGIIVEEEVGKWTSALRMRGQLGL